ncbi:MAG TPA: winged helix-turn-helix domain-containing protein [Vicinamibacteria bacterium]|nr:winged helix-turn-helix domain-containing protein [Vicinamibacteria bacterium]
MRFGRFELDRAEGRLWRGGELVPLRPKSLAVLGHLLSRRGRLVPREELLEAVWPDTSVSDTVLKVCIRELRAALGDHASNPRFIETAHRRGYRFIAAVSRGSLPAALTSFVGRDRELMEIIKLLGGARLLTLTGTGGCGKTRVALEAARLLEQPDEVHWVELADVSAPHAVASAVASSLGVVEHPGASVEDLIARRFAGRESVLLLDNCEHLADSIALVAHRLLRSAPGLRILATSREALRVDGEVTFAVPPLSADESHRLFVARAEAARNDFATTQENALLISEVCRRLDGIPLAIELAASRLQGLTLELLVERLDDRFRVLGDGVRGAAPRHQTLRATIDWSFDLLADEERRLFRRLSLFAGGFTLESAEVIGVDTILSRDRILETLSRLVAKSLVQLDREGRYRLLDTVRQYAREKIQEEGELPSVRDRYIDHFLAMAKEAEPHLRGGRRRVTLAGLRSESGNLSAALTLSTSRTDPDDLRALALGASLFWFWFFEGRWSEGQSWLERLLLGTDAAPGHDRATCLMATGILAWTGGGESEARTHLRPRRHRRSRNGGASPRRGRSITSRHRCIGARDLSARLRASDIRPAEYFAVRAPYFPLGGRGAPFTR